MSDGTRDNQDRQQMPDSFEDLDDLSPEEVAKISERQQRQMQKEQGGTPPGRTKQQNKVGESIFPTSTFHVELPSGGEFYEETSTLSNVDELEFKEMTAREENILSNKQKVKRGVALEEVLQSTLATGGIDPK